MLKIKKSFKEIIPVLTKEELKGLEASLLVEGCREPILVWGDYIIDGHNRYRICQDCKIDYQIKEIEFENEEHAKLWIVNNQLSRRNLSDYDRGVLALKKKELIKEKSKERMLKGKKIEASKDNNPMPELAQGATREVLAKEAGISHGTLDKIEKIENEASAELKEKVKSGEVSISKAHKEITKKQKDLTEPPVVLANPIEWKLIRLDDNTEYSIVIQGIEGEEVIYLNGQGIITSKFFKFLKNKIQFSNLI